MHINVEQQQLQQQLIRQDIATHIEKRGTVLDGIIVSYSSEFSKYISKLRTLGNYKYIGEYTILAASDLYQKEIQIYTSFPEPLLYYPSFGGQLNETIKLAFYEPDHYKAVIEETSMKRESSNINLKNDAVHLN